MIDLNEWKRENREDKKVEIMAWIIIGILFCLAVVASVIVFSFIIDNLIQLNNVNL